MCVRRVWVCDGGVAVCVMGVCVCVMGVWVCEDVCVFALTSQVLSAPNFLDPTHNIRVKVLVRK